MRGVMSLRLAMRGSMPPPPECSTRERASRLGWNMHARGAHVAALLGFCIRTRRNSPAWATLPPFWTAWLPSPLLRPRRFLLALPSFFFTPFFFSFTPLLFPSLFSFSLASHLLLTFFIVLRSKSSSLEC